MSEDAYGIAPAPVISGSPAAAPRSTRRCTGINIAVFKNTDNLDGASKFVKFVTSDAEQKILNTATAPIPPVTRRRTTRRSGTPATAVLKNTCHERRRAAPGAVAESQFETAVRYGRQRSCSPTLRRRRAGDHRLRSGEAGRGPAADAGGLTTMTTTH
ncbi:extracellular solute-binding protein [Streptomyces tricolor]|nr:extracellular solute-binding protein [Streptomyces tricolor]